MSGSAPPRSTPRTANPYGMLLDRGLTVELLDVAYEVAVTDPDPKTNRQALTLALRDHVSNQEAQGKTKKCLTRVWLNPPSSAQPMIDWAKTNDPGPKNRPLLHFGAILGTFPFVGVVARVIGQRLRSEGSISASKVREEVRRVVGDRPSVDVAARKAYTTLLQLGVVGRQDQELVPPTDTLIVPTKLTAWLSHALLLTRQADSLPVSSIRTAPELLCLQLAGARDRSYGLIDVDGHAGDSFVHIRPPNSRPERDGG